MTASEIRALQVQGGRVLSQMVGEVRDEVHESPRLMVSGVPVGVAVIEGPVGWRDFFVLDVRPWWYKRSPLQRFKNLSHRRKVKRKRWGR